MLRKAMGWLIAAFVVYYVVHDPQAAAATVKTIGSGVNGVATSFGDFFASLAPSSH